MACKYCEEWSGTFLFNNRNRIGKKSSGYPGIRVEIDRATSTMCIGGSADTYEPSWMECEIDINYCPKCGEKLREEKE